jgi:hypothetical protein
MATSPREDTTPQRANQRNGRTAPAQRKCIVRNLKPRLPSAYDPAEMCDDLHQEEDLDDDEAGEELEEGSDDDEADEEIEESGEELEEGPDDDEADEEIEESGEELEEGSDEEEPDEYTKKCRTILARRGKIASALDSAAYKAGNPEWARTCHLPPTILEEYREITNSLSIRFRGLQRACGDGVPLGGSSSVRKIFDDCKDPSFDPVLAYVIFSLRGDPSIPKDVASRAYSAYVVRSDAYDLTLGELIPAQLKTDAASEIAKRKYRNGTHVTAYGDWDAFAENLDSQVAGVTTGFPRLDKALGGGVSKLSIIGANEGDGKTSLLLNMVVSALRADPEIDCLFYSIDQPKSTTLHRLCSLVTECDTDTIRLPAAKRPSEVNQRIEAGVAELRDSLLPRIRLIEKPNLPRHEPITDDTFVRHYNEFRRATRATRGMLVVDLFQSLDCFPENIVAENDKDDYRLEMTRRFIDRTRSNSCPDGFPVIVTSEVRKTDRIILTSNDLRGSARLGSFATNILLLWPPENTDQFGQVVLRDVLVAKSRGGYRTRLQMQFHHKTCRFTEVDSTNATPRDSKPRSRVRPAGTEGGKAL